MEEHRRDQQQRRDGGGGGQNGGSQDIGGGRHDSDAETQSSLQLPTHRYINKNLYKSNRMFVCLSKCCTNMVLLYKVITHRSWQGL